MTMKKTSAYIFDLDYRDFPRLKRLAELSEYCKEQLDKWKLQLKVMYDDGVDSSDGLLTYCFYVGLELDNNLYETGLGAFLSDEDMIAHVENGKMSISDYAIEKIAMELEDMDAYIKRTKV